MGFLENMNFIARSINQTCFYIPYKLTLATATAPFVTFTKPNSQIWQALRNDNFMYVFRKKCTQEKSGKLDNSRWLQFFFGMKVVSALQFKTFFDSARHFFFLKFGICEDQWTPKRNHRTENIGDINVRVGSEQQIISTRSWKWRFKYTIFGILYE